MELKQIFKEYLLALSLYYQFNGQYGYLITILQLIDEFQL